MAFAALTVLACLGAAAAYEYDYAPAASPSYFADSYQQYQYPQQQYYQQQSYQYPAYPQSYRTYAQAPAKIEAAPVQAKYDVISQPSYKHAHAPCPAPVPEIKPVVVKSQLPVPFTYGVHRQPQVLEHHAAPSVFHYYGQPYVVKHTQSAVLHAYTQKPVVVDNYEHPQVHEEYAKPAVIVEEACPEVEHYHH
ncbi:unnamed protein product [Bemisia tabaci]|uniref:Cuticular protein n=1 Tax=Bemisia tabaci TaxID=7038 RepID=A0A9P0AD16_BEMTA|nr:unnamed protein product [Bemisia tabaci]